jgi:hypothetical protein
MAAADAFTVIAVPAAGDAHQAMTTVRQCTSFQRAVCGSDVLIKAVVTKPAAVQPWADTFSKRSVTVRCEGCPESSLLRICTSNAQPSHRERKFCTSAARLPCHWRGVSHSPRGQQGPLHAAVTSPVKKSAPMRAHACTDGGFRDSSSLVRRVVNWKGGAAACFDPSHRKAVGVPGNGIRRHAFAAVICPQRGPLPPCEIPIRREVPS